MRRCLDPYASVTGYVAGCFTPAAGAEEHRVYEAANANLMFVLLSRLVRHRAFESLRHVFVAPALLAWTHRLAARG